MDYYWCVTFLIRRILFLFFFAASFSVFGLDAVNFAQISFSETTRDRSREELVKGFTLLGCRWIFRCCNIPMVTTAMLKREMTVKHLRVCPQPQQFIMHLALVNQFVASKPVHSTHISPYKGEDSPTQKIVTMAIFEDKGELSAFQWIQSSCHE